MVWIAGFTFKELWTSLKWMLQNMNFFEVNLAWDLLTLFCHWPNWCLKYSASRSDRSDTCEGHAWVMSQIAKVGFLSVTASRCILMAFGTYEQTRESMSGRLLERKQLWNVQWTNDKWWSPWQEENWSILKWIPYVILPFTVGLNVGFRGEDGSCSPGL